MGVITMSNQELSRLQIIHDVLNKRLKQKDAAQILGISTRQIQRLISAYEENGPDGLVSAKRGKPSNRQYPEQYREYAMYLIKQHYADFGPTLAAEKLAELHDLHFSAGTIRQWMIQNSLWHTRKDKEKPPHQPRYRRECFGELVQIDGSQHAWFEDRGPKCTLLVYVDDATSRLVELRFVKSESTFDYFISTRRYLERYGKPVAFYSDKHSVFRVNKAGAIHGNGMTQFGRALHELNIDIICANSPQAKGRVERMNKTLQDRLVKELRLRNISDIDTANRFTDEFMMHFNAKFAKVPANEKDLHRPIYENTEEMDDIFAWREDRTVSNSLTVQYDRVMYLLEPNDVTLDLKRKKITILDYADGTISIRHEGVDLPYSVFDKVRQVKQANVVSNKRLGAVLKFVMTEQEKKSVKRSQKAPTRTGQSQHIRSRNVAVQ
jgi:transposase